MARTQTEIQRDYAQAAAELGDLEFKRSLSEDEIEKLNYQMGKRRNQMQSLTAEARKLQEKLSQATVALPAQEGVENEQQKSS